MSKFSVLKAGGNQILPVAGQVVRNEADFTSFDDVAADMDQHQGHYFVADKSITGAPYPGWYSVDVEMGSSFTTGTITASYYGGGIKVTAVSDGKIIGWQEIATVENSGLVSWQPDMQIEKGQMITFSSLGDFATGKLTNPIFKAKISHNTGSAFPSANDASSYWELVNPESYELSAKSTMFYGMTARWYRNGDKVILNAGGSFNTDGVNQIGSMTVIGDKVPKSAFYVADYLPGTDFKQVVVAFLNFNTHSDWHGQIKLGTNDPSIYVSTWLGNSQMGKSDNGDIAPVSYFTDPSTRVWSAGVPTV